LTLVFLPFLPLNLKFWWLNYKFTYELIRTFPIEIAFYGNSVQAR